MRLESLLRPEDDAPLRNPCRGWYDLAQFAPATVAEAHQVYISDDYPLALLEINWAAYRDRPIPDEALLALDTLLSRYRAANRQVILRMLYDWNGECWRTEPNDISRVLAHIEQCAPVLQAHEDTLFLLQGVLLGNWGEMHGSPLLNPENVRRLIDQLASSCHAFLAVRTPAYRRVCARSDQPTLQGELCSRLTVYNDALYSSVDDMGTYGQPNAAPIHGKRPPAEEREYLAALSKRTPLGGETAAPYADNEGNAFLAKLRELPLTYLNAGHSQAVLDRWKATPCSLKGPFRGKSCHDAIGAYLGYRLVASALKLRRDKLCVDLANIGSAPLYRRETVAWELTGNEQRLTLPLDTDTRDWSTTIELTTVLPPLPKGDWELRLCIGEIQLANAPARSGDRNLLGILHI